MQINGEKLRPLLAAYVREHDSIFESDSPDDFYLRKASQQYRDQIADIPLTTLEPSHLDTLLAPLIDTKIDEQQFLDRHPVGYADWWIAVRRVCENDPGEAAAVLSQFFDESKPLKERLDRFEYFFLPRLEALGETTGEFRQSWSPSPFHGLSTFLLEQVFPDTYVAYSFRTMRNFFDSYTDYCVESASATDIPAQYAELLDGFEAIREELASFMPDPDMHDVHAIIYHWEEISERAPEDLSPAVRPMWKFICSDDDCQQVFTEKSIENDNHHDVHPGDGLVMYDISDSVVYGPLEAISDDEHDDDVDGSDGNIPEQLSIGWDGLYRIPHDEFPVALAERQADGSYKDTIDADKIDAVIDAFEEEGIPITVTDDGSIDAADDASTAADGGDTETTSSDDEMDETQIDDAFERVTAEENPVRDIITAAEADPDRSPVDVLREAPEPGEVFIEQTASDELRRSIYREALAHVVAGKNIVFYGPPGSGKTRCARLLGESICHDLSIETANSEWTYHDVVGGYKPDGESFEPSKGCFTTAAADCATSLRDTSKPSWLLIDELNRANLDQAFGEVFTQLDLSHRLGNPIEYVDSDEVPVPLSFRVLATMNSTDRAQLFSLGYAFMRRFAFINVPSLFVDRTPEDGAEPDSTARSDGLELQASLRDTRLVLERAVIDQFHFAGQLTNDTALGVPYLAELFDAGTELDTAIETLGHPATGVDPLEALLLFVQALGEHKIVDVGQGIVIDAMKFIVAYRFLFPQQSGWKTVDDAVVAYILPQIESYMPTLRRESTIGQESEAEEAFADVIDVARALSFDRTAARLEAALAGDGILS